MTRTSSSTTLRGLTAAFAAALLLMLWATAAGATTVHLRVEGASATHFSGDVDTSPGDVPGAPDRPACRSNTTPATFSSANPITAVRDALGAGKVTTSGTFYNWGTMLCSVDGEFPADVNGGWLVRINQQDTTAPGGYVTATNPLSDGDSVVLFLSPAWGFYSSSLELHLPAEARPGEPVTGWVDSFSMATDAKSPAASVNVSGGGASAQTGVDGSFRIAFPATGRYLVTAGAAGAVRGSQWVTVNPAAQPKPVVPPTQAQIDRRRRIAARANCRARAVDSSGFDLRGCIRTANQLGRKLTAKQRRVNARARCVANFPARGTASRVRCVRAANQIGR
jgi:hypothetical protein